VGAGIAIKGVSHRYAGPAGQGLPVLDNVSVTVQPGGVTAIVGPSGCGKSTLLLAMAGLLQPSIGTIEREAGTVGLVPQRPGLLRWRTVAENVALPLEIANPTGAHGPAVEEALEAVGLVDRAHAYPETLSGGMQSRGAIARALAGKPRILLLDEPFGALDELTGQRLIVTLSALLAQSRPTTVMITHSLTHAAFLADQIVVLSAAPGRIIDVVDVQSPTPRRVNFLDTEAFRAALGRTRQSLWGAA
jgi:NitT/TauT family transport system ATP-binding protein